ncbi:MAG: hypothetical protein IH859_01410 [Chloroflexi bacterium]|nr:hypothetical protein [Chloroflexota bacterium]
MKMRKAVLVTLILTLLLVVSFSSASANIPLKSICPDLRGDYDEANKTCTIDRPWVEDYCFSITGERNQVYVIGIINNNWYYEDCVSRVVSAAGTPVDLYSGNCGAYVANPPAGGISLIKLSKFKFWFGGQYGKLLADACQLQYSHGSSVYAWVYFNLTEVNAGKYDRGELNLMVWNGDSFEDCGAPLVSGGDFGRLACATKYSTFALLRQ